MINWEPPFPNYDKDIQSRTEQIETSNENRKTKIEGEREILVSGKWKLGGLPPSGAVRPESV
jgi:hypothetical protein